VGSHPAENKESKTISDDHSCKETEMASPRKPTKDEIRAAVGKTIVGMFAPDLHLVLQH